MLEKYFMIGNKKATRKNNTLPYATEWESGRFFWDLGVRLVLDQLIKLAGIYLIYLFPLLI
jgi:hypothetical protein